MRCANDGWVFYTENPAACPRCGKRDFVPDNYFIEVYLKSGKYEDAALEYEKIKLYDLASECRKMGRNKTFPLSTLTCGDCQKKILQPQPSNCPYCGSKNVLTKRIQS